MTSAYQKHMAKPANLLFSCRIFTVQIRHFRNMISLGMISPQSLVLMQAIQMYLNRYTILPQELCIRAGRDLNIMSKCQLFRPALPHKTHLSRLRRRTPLQHGAAKW